MSALTAIELPPVAPSEVRNAIVSFLGKLDSGELLTGTPTVTATPSGLTFANVAVNTTSKTLNNGVVCAAGQAVQFKVSGQTAGAEYQITITATTDSTPAQTCIIYATLKCRAS